MVSLRLGSIIYNPKEPGESLNEGDIVDISEDILHTSRKYNWEQTIDWVNNGRVGIWGRCVHLLVGLGGNLGASIDTTGVDFYRFRQLETTYFFPSQEYLEQAVSKPAVSARLKGTRYRPVYMITGLKIVRGPGSRVTTQRSMAREGNVNFGFPGIMGAGPFTLDALNTRLHQAGTTNTSFEGSDFVFGYRLGKVTFEKDEDCYTAKQQTCTDGAMLGIKKSQGSGDGRNINIGMKVVFEGDDAVSEELPSDALESAFDEDGNEECQCFIVPLEPAS
jgi:hypothetical protein